jgi:hypothetical protein
MKQPVKPVPGSPLDFPQIIYTEEHAPTQPMPLKDLPRQVRIDHELAIIRADHERIARKIEVFWGEQECIDYVRQLILDGSDDLGRTRSGFKREVLAALINLLSLHQLRNIL